MATILKTKNSVTAASAPSSLVQGELAVNITDKKMWVGNASSTPVQIVGNGVAGGAGGSTTQVQYNSSGVLAGSANMTFSGTALTLANDASINSITVGRAGGNLASNTIFGNSSFGSNTGGQQNSAFGYQALLSVTNADSNTAVGSQAMRSNTTGSNHTSVGNQALYSNLTGNNNTALGYRSLYNYTASGSTAIGYNSGYSMTSGFISAAVGHSSLYSNTTGASCVAIGYNSLYANTTGNYNVAVGEQALQSNTTGSYNTAVGYQAGYSSAYNGNAFNTFIGSFAGYGVTTGVQNTFVGGGTATGNAAAGYYVTTGSKNTIIGLYNGNNGGLDIRTASNYIVLSDGDGNPRGVFDSSGNLLVGATSSSRANTRVYIKGPDDNQLTLDSNTGANYTSMYFYNNGTYKVGINFDNANTRFNIQNNGGGVYLANNATSWTAASDERKKDIIEPISNAIEKVSSLRAIIGKYKTDEEGTRRSFLIAQDVQAVLPEAVDATNPDELGVQYTEVIPLLVASIKELNAKVEAQALEIATLKGN